MLDGLLGLVGLDEVEVRAAGVLHLGRGEDGHLALVDAVGVGDDRALRGLAEDLRQPADRHRAASR